MRYVLDTDAISAFQRGDVRVVACLRAVEPAVLGVAIVSVEEQLAGRLAVLHRARGVDLLIREYLLLAEALAFFAAADVLAYDSRATTIDAQLMVSVRRLGTMDRRIASIRLGHGATLVTGNVKDFSLVPDLLLLEKGLRTPTGRVVGWQRTRTPLGVWSGVFIFTGVPHGHDYSVVRDDR